MISSVSCILFENLWLSCDYSLTAAPSWNGKLHHWTVSIVIHQTFSTSTNIYWVRTGVFYRWACAPKPTIALQVLRIDLVPYTGSTASEDSEREGFRVLSRRSLTNISSYCAFVVTIIRLAWWCVQIHKTCTDVHLGMECREFHDDNFLMIYNVGMRWKTFLYCYVFYSTIDVLLSRSYAFLDHDSTTSMPPPQLTCGSIVTLTI
jgi:hypothetical protein